MQEKKKKVANLVFNNKTGNDGSMGEKLEVCPLYQLSLCFKAKQLRDIGVERHIVRILRWRLSWCWRSRDVARPIYFPLLL